MTSDPDASARRAVPRSVLASVLLLVVVLSLALAAGCRKKPLAPAEIRSITRALVLAAKQATAGNVNIGMWPENAPQPAGGRPGQAPAELATDHIYISFPFSRLDQADAGALQALQSELDRVAGQHGLKREGVKAAAGLVRFDYRRGDQRTHAIHIFTPLAGRRREASRAGGRVSSARLAIIIDDLGYDRAAARMLFALPYPLTFAVLPNLAHSADLAEEAHRRGYQVMLHLPMESANGDAKPEALGLRRGMTPEEVARLLAAMLETVPHAAGVNNHQGSLATADAQLMAAVMRVLRERELFFIDSRTTTATLAYAAAARAGVRAASRKVFLDDTPTREAIREQLALAARLARRQGSAIAIGHPYPATLQALEEYLPQLDAQGIGLVFASELVR